MHDNNPYFFFFFWKWIQREKKHSWSKFIKRKQILSSHIKLLAMPACGATHMRFLLFLVTHVHVLGIQVIISTLEKVFQRDLLCLLFFFFSFNGYKSIPGLETQKLTTGFWSLLPEVLKSCIALVLHLFQKYLNHSKRWAYFLIISEYWNVYILALIRSACFPVNTGLSLVLHNLQTFFWKADIFFITFMKVSFVPEPRHL